MKEELIGVVEQDVCYSETYTDIAIHENGSVYTQNIHHIFEEFAGKKVRITIQSLDKDGNDEVEEDFVTVTYLELFKRCDDRYFHCMGVNIHYLNEGGDPTALKDLPKSHALIFMSEEEFAGRCHSEVNA